MTELIDSSTNNLRDEANAFDKTTRDPNKFPVFIDVEATIKDWAKKRYFKLADKKQKKIEEEYLLVNISWNSASFLHGKPLYRNKQQQRLPKGQILFVSVFENDTNVEQEYSLQTERSTCSTCEVSYDKGYTVGYEIDLKLGLPEEILCASTGFHKEITLSKNVGETIEETVKWSVNNQIKVPKNSKVKASVDLVEEEFFTEFEINSFLKGVIEVTFTDRRSGEFISMLPAINVVEDIFENLKKLPGTNFEITELSDEQVVKFITVGRVKFTYGIKQLVSVVTVNDKN